MKTIITIPTYNERANIGQLLTAIEKLPLKTYEIVVVDDNSPDRTADVVREHAKKNKNITCIVRTKRRGRGLAGKVGYRYALDHGAEYVIEMDADFSHNPKYIPQMLHAIQKADLVLGSRGVRGGRDVGRSPLRQLITKLANLYIRIVLGLHVKDCNSGFRCFRRQVLEAIRVEKIAAKGPDIVQEVLFKAHLKGFEIVEIPIVFKDRTRGATKLGIEQLITGYLKVLKLKFLSLVGRL